MSMKIKGKRRLFKKLDEKIKFGLYREKTIEDVLKEDINYLIWMHNNTNNKIGRRLLKEIEKEEKYIGLFKKI